MSGRQQYAGPVGRTPRGRRGARPSSTRRSRCSPARDSTADPCARSPKRVGVTPTGLLHHFADKEELFAEVLRQRDEKVRAAAGDPAEHTLIEQAKRVVAHNQTSRGLTSLYAIVSAEATDPEHPSHADFATRYRARAAEAEAILRRGQDRRRGARRHRPGSSARLISAVMDGIQLQWLLDDSVDMVPLFDEFVRRYLPPADRSLD